MPNINKKLVLNKHPKDCEDLVLINARNVKVSNDFSCLQSENSIFHNKVIESFINNNFGNDWNIAGVIPCNVELILIVYKGDSFPTNASIVRYNEDKNSCEISYNKFEYHGGEIKGTFTYNVQSNLILSIAEYNTKFNIPLRTINIGKFGINGDDTDVNLKNGLLSNAPEVYIPKLINQEYVVGNAYKGWYNFFIRFKINKVDYTSWFHLGYPIFVSDLIERDIIKYYYSGWINDLPDSSGKWKLYFMTGCSDYISDDTEIANETVAFDINGLNKSEQLGYKYYQIGFICATKDSQKAFKTNDIKINVTNYKLEINNCVTYSVTNLITDNYNFYNVKNIINYQNRLYIANYNEENIPNIDLSNVILRWNQENIVYDDYYKHSIYFAYEKGCTDIETKVKTKQNNTNRIIKRKVAAITNVTPSYIKSINLGKIPLDKDKFEFNENLITNESFKYEYDAEVCDINGNKLSTCILSYRKQVDELNCYSDYLITAHINTNTGEKPLFRASGSKCIFNNLILTVAYNDYTNISYSGSSYPKGNVSYIKTTKFGNIDAVTYGNRFKFNADLTSNTDFNYELSSACDADDNPLFPVYVLYKRYGKEQTQYFIDDCIVVVLYYQDYHIKRVSYAAGVISVDAPTIASYQVKATSIDDFKDDSSGDDNPPITNTKPSYIKSDHFGKINLNATTLIFKTSLFNQGSTETETAHLYNDNNELIGNITLSWTRNGYGSQGGGYMQYDIDGIYNGVQYWHARGLTALNVPSEVQLTVSINNFKENGEISPDVSSLTSFDFINTNNSYNRRKKETTLIPGETYAFYIHFVNKYGEVSRGYKLPNNGRGNFNLVINKNGDALFKVPYIELSNFKDNIIKPRLTLQIDFGNTYIPNEYVGYFLTYEQFESTCKTTGVLTKFDFYNKEQKATKIASTVFTNKTIVRNENYNAIDSDNLTTVKFYSSEFDITDNLELKYNKLRLEKKNCFDVQDWVYGDIDVGVTDIFIINPAVVNAKFAYNLNIPEKGGTSVNIEIPINKYNIKVAGDATEGQNGLGTCLEITLPTSTIKELFPNGEYVLYKASLLNDTTELYVNENKNLIKFTNIEYFAEGKVKEFKEGLNGHSTYNDFLIYNWNKFIFDSGKNVILNYSYNAYYPTWAFGSNFQLDDNLFKYSHPAAYLQLAVYKDKMLEAKSFKNPPKACVTQLSEASETEENQTFIFGNGCIVEPSDTVDLFKEKYYNQDVSNPKTYTNYDKNISYLNVYNKRIYRSNVIQDESNENAWRTFPLEGYKDITENKGNITNLLAMGTTLLVHTEHSLFMFNRDNTMKTQDKDVQLAMPDIFDIDYKEVFTSTLGVCGLQDDRAWVADDFGYIFYDNDAHRLYQFGQGKINNLDNDIIQWLNKYKPNRVRFANDKISNRLLIRFDYQDITKQDNKVISFNYKLGNYISFHDYIFEEGINTKNKLYFFTGRKDNQLKSIFNIDYSNLTNTSYNNFENYTKQLINSSQIDILILGTYITDKGSFTIYDTVKYLEYLTYKLYKIDKSNEDYVQLPVEELKLPYSGDTLRVFNHNIDTGILDINIDTEKAKNAFANYKKPYWDLDNWNFSYLRNKGSQHDGKQIYGDIMSRLYGNYFIASFTFSDSERRVEFEDLKYSITKDKKL